MRRIHLYKHWNTYSQVHIYTSNWQLHGVITSFGFIKVVRFLRSAIEIQPLIDCWTDSKKERNTHTQRKRERET